MNMLMGILGVISVVIVAAALVGAIIACFVLIVRMVADI